MRQGKTVAQVDYSEGVALWALLGCALLLLVACGKRAPTAPEAVRCVARTVTIPLRNAVGDSVGTITVTAQQCGGMGWH